MIELCHEKKFLLIFDFKQTLLCLQMYDKLVNLSPFSFLLKNEGREQEKEVTNRFPKLIHPLL